MIVYTSVDRTVRHVALGDEFVLTVRDPLGSTVVVREKIVVAATIDFVASYRFARPDGTVSAFHLCGIFGNSGALPQEFADAVMFDDLNYEQKKNFAASCGTLIDGVIHV